MENKRVDSDMGSLQEWVMNVEDYFFEVKRNTTRK